MAVRLTIAYPPRPGRGRLMETEVYDSRAAAIQAVRDEFPFGPTDDAAFCLALAAERNVLLKFEEA